MVQENYEIGLFDGYDFGFEQVPSVRVTEKEDYRDPLHLDMCEGITFTGSYEMPMILPCDIAAPVDIVCFNRVVSRSAYWPYVFPHFYGSDDIIERVWNHWREYEKRLSVFPGVIGPDFSMFTDMHKPHKMFNNYRCKLLTARWQRDGLTVVPNITWSDKASYSYAAEGYPKRSVIAINSTGLRRDKEAIALWRDGYEYMVDLLQPTLILRYGAKQDGEIEAISRYYRNDNFKSACHGS